MKQLALYLATPFVNLYKKWDKWYKARQLEKCWAVETDAELAKLDGKKYPWYPILVENQKSYLRMHHEGMFAVQTASPFLLFRIACASLRNLTTLSEIVGFQPMQGPAGLVYHLGFKTGNNQSDDYGGEGKAARMVLEVTSDAVQAGSRKLSTVWTPEVAQDAAAVLGNEYEQELVELFAHEIAYEITREVLNDLRVLAMKNKNLGTFPEEVGLTSIKINAMCNDIARTARRGAGNFVVGSPMFVTMLQVSKVFTPVKGADMSSGLAHVGFLNNTIKVYCSIYATDDVIVGYKGGNSEIDAGYVYCPYITLMSTGVIIDPQTFNPKVAFMTRYGKWYPEATENFKPFATGDAYYRTIKEPTFAPLKTSYDPSCLTEDYFFSHSAEERSGSTYQYAPSAKLDAHGYTDLESFQQKLADNLRLPEGTNPEVDQQVDTPDNDQNANSASE